MIGRRFMVLMEGLEDELTCPVCLELFTCPLQLPCNHNLCRRCAEVLLHTETDPGHDDEEEAACSAASAPGSDNKPDSFSCPTCREEVSLDSRGLDGLRKNLLLQNIVERYLKLKGKDELPQIPCQLCKNTPPKIAAKSCLVCKVSYCEQCLTLTHPAFPPFTEHELVSPRTSFDESPQAVMCSDHPKEPVKMYCVEDQTPVCSLCKMVGRHKDHNMAALEEVFSQRRADLQEGVDRLGAWVAQGEEKVRKLQEKQKDVETRAGDIKARATEECEALHEVIRQRRTAIHHRVELARMTDEDHLQIEVHKTNDALHKARSTLAYAQEALKETDHASFLQAAAAVMAKLGGTGEVFNADCEDMTSMVAGIKIDLSQTKEILNTIDIGEPPQVPVILDQQCLTTLDTACIKWQHDDTAHEYEVRFKTGTVQMAATVSDRSFTAKSLSPGTKYKFEVRSKNKHGSSPEASIEVVTKTPPAAPTILTKKCSTTTDEAHITWKPMTGSAEYEVRYTAGAASVSTVVRDNSFTAKKLTPATKYKFEVRSRNEIGTSVASIVELVTKAGFQFHIDPNTPDRAGILLLEQSRCVRLVGEGTRTFLGDTPIASGRHYWEVSVNSTSYSVGVAYADMPMKNCSSIRDTSKAWAFDRSGTSYKVVHNRKTMFEEEKKTHPSKIGVLVDHNSGQLSFYNADTQTLIYTHRTTFTQPLYPAFSLWNGSIKIHSGLVCPY